MKAIEKHILVRAARIVSLSLLLLSSTLFAQGNPIQEQDTARAMADVVKIAHAISIVRPRLEEPKYFEYALGIYRASKKYDIRPGLIIAIAHQESSFQERLPEGKAGELGITQVLKRWVNNPKFRREFPGATEKSFRKPAESFLYTAWILAELKRDEAPGTLPFWSFYNARQFKNRIKYFVRVNKHMGKLKKNLHLIEDALNPGTAVARRSTPESNPILAYNPPRNVASNKPKWVARPKAAAVKVAAPKPTPTPSYPWLAELPQSPKSKASAKRDPRELLLRSASMGG